MRIDIVNLFGRNPCLIQGLPQELSQRCPIGWQGGHMVRVDIGTESNKLSVDVCVACQCQVSILQEQHACTLCHDKAVSAFVIGAGCPLRIVITRTHSSQDAKNTHHSVSNGRVGSACQHCV